nr:hypothetical protein [Pseudomonas fluorescens]
MIIENKQMDNELFYEPEDGFWLGTDKLLFESQNLEEEWPLPQNPFIKKMAELDRIARGIQNISATDLKQIIGVLVQDQPSAVFRFLVVPMQRNGRTVSVKLLGKVNAELPPLRSDNSCSLVLAVEWMAKRYSHFEMSCAADGNYWIHKQ